MTAGCTAMPIEYFIHLNEHRLREFQLRSFHNGYVFQVHLIECSKPHVRRDKCFNLMEILSDGQQLCFAAYFMTVGKISANLICRYIGTCFVWLGKYIT